MARVGATSQKRRARTKRVWLAIVAVVSILGLAWFDGGEGGFASDFAGNCQSGAGRTMTRKTWISASIAAIALSASFVAAQDAPESPSAARI